MGKTSPKGTAVGHRRSGTAAGSLMDVDTLREMFLLPNNRSIWKESCVLKKKASQELGSFEVVLWAEQEVST